MPLLARISHTPPADVARALVPAASALVPTLGAFSPPVARRRARPLVSTPFRFCDPGLTGSVGTRADAADTSVRATKELD
jgi:hypothetical protein